MARRRTAPARTIYVVTPFGVYEPTVQAATVSDWLQQIARYREENRLADPWIEVDGSDTWIRYSAVTAVTAAETRPE